jgi:diguanylate cyclase (GGDEF)-like protein/PAS domain S-box-containing protein
MDKKKDTKILLIEDNLDYARLIQRILSSKSSSAMSVVHHDTFTAGFERLLEGDIDLVLLDLDLPDSGTTDTILQIHQGAEVPIIVLTGTDDEHIVLKSVQKGAQDYLMKSRIDSSLLIRSIKYAIERKKVDDKLKRTEERFRLLIENTVDLIAILDLDGTIKYVSPSHKRIVGYDEQDMLGKKAFEFVHPEDLPRVVEIFSKGIQQISEGVYDDFSNSNEDLSNSAEFRFRHKDGYWITLESIGSMYPPESGDTGVIINSRDITERKKMEESLRNLSVTDDLTNLYNRRGFLSFAEHHIQAADRKKQKLLLILIDLDGLKLINDAFGHKEGDMALIDTAEIIKNTFRKSDLIARVSGDEFVVLTTDTKLNAAQAIRERMEENIAAHNAKQKRLYKISLSFGISIYDPYHPSTIDRLIVKADELMYMDKHKKEEPADAIVINLNRTGK